jgi:SAM-dependent methyltransferase
VIAVSVDAGARAARTTCLICGGDRHRVVLHEQGIDILGCRGCGHVFSSFAADPHFAGFWGEQVPADEHDYWDNARRRMHDEFMARFVAGRSGRLLDMGCGLGFFLKRVAASADWSVHGCEVSPVAAKYCREVQRLPDVACEPLADYHGADASFDIVTMWDVLDHLAAPDPVLRRCHGLLKNDGLLFIRTPNIRIQLPRARLNKLLSQNGDAPAGLQPFDHQHHYSASSLRRLLTRNGFHDIEFIHLLPIQSRAGRFSSRWIKGAWFIAVKAIDRLSLGHLNLDNLFVIARKAPA